MLIGHQGTQAEETSSKVSSPVAVDTQSVPMFDQSDCSICLSILIQSCSYWTRWPYAACSHVVIL